MTWKKLAVFHLLLCVSPQVTAQEKPIELSKVVIDEEIQKSLFESTHWVPKGGIILLKQEDALNAWSRMQREPCLNTLPTSPVYGLIGFKTEHLYIFSYRNQLFTDWVVCRKNGALDFHAHGISGGFSRDNPKQGQDICSAGNNNVNVRFRRYEKTGPLLLEVDMGGCRIEAKYELLFALDRDELYEVPGSRFTIEDFRSDQGNGWFYWPVKYNDYTRFEKLSWNEDDELQWQKTLYKIPTQFHDPNAHYDHRNIPKITKSCHYSKDNKKIVCKDKLKNKTELKMEHIYEQCKVEDVCGYDEVSLSYLSSIKQSLPSTFKDLGYFMKEDEKNKLEKSITKIQKRIH